MTAPITISAADRAGPIRRSKPPNLCSKNCVACRALAAIDERTASASHARDLSGIGVSRLQLSLVRMRGSNHNGKLTQQGRHPCPTAKRPGGRCVSWRGDAPHDVLARGHLNPASQRISRGCSGVIAEIRHLTYRCDWRLAATQTLRRPASAPPNFRNATLDYRHHALAVHDLRQPGGSGLRAELFGTYHETLIISNDGVCTANGRYYAARW